jgi:hypothetical protein
MAARPRSPRRRGVFGSFAEDSELLARFVELLKAPDDLDASTVREMGGVVDALYAARGLGRALPEDLPPLPLSPAPAPLEARFLACFAENALRRA